MTAILRDTDPRAQARHDLAASLRTWSGDDQEQRAAVELLLGLDPNIWSHPALTEHMPFYGSLGRGVKWQALARERALLSLPDSTRATVLVACSLGDPRVEPPIVWCLEAMSDVDRARAVDAIRAWRGGAE